MKPIKLSSLAVLMVALAVWVAPWGLLIPANAQSAPHSITLSWVAPSPIGGSGTIAGYNVYRSTTTGGPYTKLTSTPVTPLSYSDTTGAAGTTYFYVVTTVDSAGNESVDSIQVSAVAVGNPNPPIQVVATSK